jgi:2'-5' RNA ligase
MIYALIHYPNIETERIDEFRRMYDPQVDLIKPHITLMFPVPEAIGEADLVNHLDRVLREHQAFPVQLVGLERSGDDYLYLLVREGKESVVDLHEHIYTGLLADYRRTDVTYIPHLTLGMFAARQNEFSGALEEATQLNLDYQCTLDRLHLVKIDFDLSRIVWNKEFCLA